RAGERAGDPSHHVRRRRYRGRARAPADPRRGANRRGGGVSGQLPTLLRPWTRGNHDRAGRAAQLTHAHRNRSPRRSGPVARTHPHDARRRTSGDARVQAQGRRPGGTGSTSNDSSETTGDTDMAVREPTDVKNLDQYGNDPLPWSRARDALVEHPAGVGVPYFLGTSTPDGRTHAAGVGAIWIADVLYVVSGPGTRKSREL